MNRRISRISSYSAAVLISRRNYSYSTSNPFSLWNYSRKSCIDDADGFKLVNLDFVKLKLADSLRVRCYSATALNVAQVASLGQGDSKAVSEKLEDRVGGVQQKQIGENVSRKDKIEFLLKTLFDLTDSKEAVYGALDAWVAWESNFPIASLKRVLTLLEEEQQWHRVIQVIKWMLSKGQGNTMGTYGQLIRALDMDHRAKEAHMFWLKKIGSDLHSVPWQLCHRMISVYHRNNMLENLIKLFKGLEAFGRKPPDKLIVQKVADAYEMLGMVEDKERLLQRYKTLFEDTENGYLKKSRYSSSKKKSGGKTRTSNSDACVDT
ncbi:pentatricopeptide repeat-containing protein At4g18975, chloroplastic [Mercurialis annua]|uniref:pentatricopeptide repeat-containing protein At4g18975, chloroplastic n=1 Tax=Mercurialis annua TaxID=3986 RepID=UPI00215E5FDF|nr:pentatricopeptide repeat-containing protein At4g18975, chloroplastic [Mercurialis annua]